MKYIKLVIAIDEEYQESLIAELLELEFDAFEQQNDSLITYVPGERFSDVYRERIEQVLNAYPGEGFIQSEEVVADQNWNERWEETIRGQEIGRFYVKPTWSRESPPGDSILLEVDPKMSFGTGYHETTRLMLRLLPEAIRPGDRVIDAGTGTGILAIVSVKLGAGYVLAFDVDEWSITNAQENVLLNEAGEQVDVRKGSEELIPVDGTFDVLLANIERNTILSMMPAFKKGLKPEGRLLLSGFLEDDRAAVQRALEGYGLSVRASERENEWIAIRAVCK